MADPKWMTKYGESPVYSINKFVQDKLIEMEFIDISKYVSDFSGDVDQSIPFLIPGQEISEIETIYDQTGYKDLAYGIYSVSHRYCSDEPYMLCGQIAYTFYHGDVDTLMAMADYLVDIISREDWTANDINYHFRANAAYPFEFKTIYVLTTAGPAPAEDEGGRNSFMIVVRYDATYEGAGRAFTMNLSNDSLYIEQGMR